jgi:hypothetical protein
VDPVVKEAIADQSFACNALDLGDGYGGMLAGGKTVSSVEIMAR